MKKGKRGRPKGAKNKAVKPARILKSKDSEIQLIAEKLNTFILKMNELEEELKDLRKSPYIRTLIRAGKPKRKPVKKKK